MNKKRNIFESSIYEAAYKDLKELEDFEKVYNTRPVKKVNCPKQDCQWSGFKLKTFQTHVKDKHRNDYDSLRGFR
jgi:hypothetical protein